MNLIILILFIKVIQQYYVLYLGLIVTFGVCTQQDIFLLACVERCE